MHRFGHTIGGVAVILLLLAAVLAVDTTSGGKRPSEAASRDETVPVRDLNTLGISLASLGRTEEAIAIFEKAIRAHGESVRQGHSSCEIDLAAAHNNLGNVLRNHGKFDRAVEALNDAIQVYERLRERGSVDAMNGLANSQFTCGIVLSRLGRLHEAAGDFGAVIRLSKGVSKSRLAQALHSRGVVLRNLGQSSEAVDDLSKAVDMFTQLDRDDQTYSVHLARSLHDRAIAHFQQEELTEALAGFETAVDILSRLVEEEGRAELTSEFAQALNNRAWLLVSSFDPKFVDQKRQRRSRHGRASKVRPTKSANGSVGTFRGISYAPCRFHR